MCPIVYYTPADPADPAVHMYIDTETHDIPTHSPTPPPTPPHNIRNTNEGLDALNEAERPTNNREPRRQYRPYRLQF